MKKEWFIFIIILFLSSLFEFVGLYNSIRYHGENISNFILKYNVYLVEKVSQPFNFLSFEFNKSKYLKQIEASQAVCLSRLNELDALKVENEELKKLLGSNLDNSQSKSSSILTAPIVSLSFPAVGVGLDNNIKEKDMVLVHDVLVGTITKVTQHQSQVLLLTEKRKSKILVQTQSGIKGVVEGDGQNVLLTNIPKSTKILEGERVMTLGQEGIEKNVLIGVVQKDISSPSQVSSVFIINQLVSFYSAVLVEVR